MSELPDPLGHRTADHPIEELFLRRWSPRAMTGESISTEELMRLFEAARWAPSTYNEQEWRFLYAPRESAHWQTFFELLSDGNKPWCKHAAVLILAASCKVMSRNGKPNPVHSLDTGLAVQNLLLQGTTMNLVCHGMAGFNQQKARVDLKLPDDYEPECMIAVGRPGDPDDLPEDYRKMDLEPSGRKPLSEIIAEGPFAF